MKTLICMSAVLLLATSAYGLEAKAYQMREDFGTEPVGDYPCQYYYYIPCPTYSWFWAYTGWEPGDWVGVGFTCWEEHTGCYEPNDPYLDHTLQQIRVLDFAGYGTVYPGLFTVDFYVFCMDLETFNPVDEGGFYMPLYYSGPVELHFGWNYIPLSPPFTISPCMTGPGPPPSYPAILVMAQHTGTSGGYPAWGLDNISTAIETGCALHDVCCLPAHYPRPYACYWDRMHSGYYGNNPASYPGHIPFPYCPPLNFVDGRDTTCASLAYPDGACGTQYGFLELAWRIYLDRSGPSAVEGTSWGSIKSIYR